MIFPSVPAFQPTSIRSVRPAGPVVGRPIRPRRLHAPFHHEPDCGGEILLRSDGKKSQHLHAPRSGPPAATLIGGLRPGSLRVHDPCNITRTDRASVSQAVASRGAPPLPAMSLGTCGCCRRKHDGCVREGEGGWAWTRRNLVCGRPGSRRRSGAQAGVAVLLPYDSLGAEVPSCTRPTHGIVPPGKPHSPSPPGLGCQRGSGRGAEGAGATEPATRGIVRRRRMTAQAGLAIDDRTREPRVSGVLGFPLTGRGSGHHNSSQRRAR